MVYKHSIFCMQMESTSQSMRFCIECKTLLDISKFDTKRARNLCKKHSNKKHSNFKKVRWTKNPLERRAYVIWQMAYIDAQKTFQLKLEVKPSHVIKLLEENNFDVNDCVRLIPIDPLKPLSMTNYCFVDGATKYDICLNWRQLHDPDSYKMCFDPRCMKKIYVLSNPELINK